MIVLKFGGTSVADRNRMDAALRIAADQIDAGPVLVSSALAGVTDTLISLAALATAGDTESVAKSFATLESRHYEAVSDLEDPVDALSRLSSLFDELRGLLSGLSLLKECSPRTYDAVLAFGEILSTTVLHARAVASGLDALLLDSRDFMITDSGFTAAIPDFDKTNKAVRDAIRPSKGRLYITQGFIGRAPNGATTTLGRGGSDYTATILGAALGASEVQIWTDVNGIMTSDPRVVAGARTVDTLSYEEAAELAYFGAKVVHPSTIQPAIELGIPVLVKNTSDPDGPFTAIKTGSSGTGIRAIAGKKRITLINITSSRMLNAYGFLSRIFAVFEQHRTSVDLVATSEVSVSVTVDNNAHVDQIVDDLKQYGTVGVEDDKAIICLVGKNLWKNSSFIAEVLNCLKSIQVRMISLGSSDINLSLVVPEIELENAMRTLHARFFSTGT
ncbi:MAG: lysine-sensitive aspartokinase 3 [Spirochaetales bacterium]|nr:lysine-sensitive aspartokinase 3 [Spirochaetales bacterium]